ncbi:hypothetical protein BU17DRAFT_69789 [Hysterangium stoloniferum]|nr:hypothetical protein BU17DRAFT_69789 [Hysterangium stoloniferum]
MSGLEEGDHEPGHEFNNAMTAEQTQILRSTCAILTTADGNKHEKQARTGIISVSLTKKGITTILVFLLTPFFSSKILGRAAIGTGNGSPEEGVENGYGAPALHIPHYIEETDIRFHLGQQWPLAASSSGPERLPMLYRNVFSLREAKALHTAGQRYQHSGRGLDKRSNRAPGVRAAASANLSPFWDAPHSEGRNSTLFPSIVDAPAKAGFISLMFPPDQVHQ